MGVMDYSCYCCNHGEQSLIHWEESEGRNIGRSKAYLLIFSDPQKTVKDYRQLLSEKRKYRLQEYEYSWGNWDFEPNLDYSSILADSDGIECAVWYCRKLKSWVINLCPYCYESFLRINSEFPKKYKKRVREYFDRSPKRLFRKMDRKIEIDDESDNSSSD